MKYALTALIGNRLQVGSLGTIRVVGHPFWDELRRAVLANEQSHDTGSMALVCEIELSEEKIREFKLIQDSV